MTIPVMSLRKLRDRLSDVIADQERRGHPEHADLPIYYSLTLERGRGEWFLPAEFVHGSRLGLRMPEGLVEVFQITGHEDRAIKNFAHRARRNSGYPRCGHCHKRAKPVECQRCSRPMCESCIQLSGLCGICEDEAKGGG